jgi:hypothetical protein
LRPQFFWRRARRNADERVTAFEHAYVVYFMGRFPVVAT